MAVIVVNFGSHLLIEQNLGSITLPPDTRVVVVDNFLSAVDTAAIRVLCAERGWQLIELPANRGFGAATNVGMRWAADAGCACFLMLNPDASLSATAMTQLHAHSLADPSALITPRIVTSSGQVAYRGSQVELAGGRISGQGLPDGDDGSTLRLDGDAPSAFPGAVQGWLPGTCLVMHRSMLERTGGYADRYFLYWEDVELSRRVELAGGTLQVRQDLVAVHDEGGTHGAQRTRARSTTYYRYNCRNRLLFAADHLGRREVARWAARTPRESWLILMRGGKRQLLHSPRPLWSAVRGSVEGLLVALAAVVGLHHRSTALRSVLVAHPGAELYGSDRVMLESVTALARSGHDVTVALAEDGPLVALLRERGAHVVTCPMPVLRKSALRPRGFAALVGEAVRGLIPALRLVRTAGRHGVYVSTLTIPSWLLYSRLLRRRVVCHVHEAEASAPRALRIAMAAPLGLANRLLVNSQFSLDVLASVAPRLRTRAEVVLNAVPGPAEVIASGPDVPTTPQLLYVGRLSPRKGTDVAVAALADLVARGVDAELVLLGSVFEGYEWFERDLHAQVTAAGLAERVVFAGFEPDVWPRLRAADLVLVPSVVDEPFGNTAVEAVLAARPLVVSSTSGLREAAAGYRSAQFVPPGDPGAIADAVQFVLERWGEFDKLAVEDSGLARQRHGLATYREQIVTALA